MGGVKGEEENGGSKMKEEREDEGKCEWGIENYEDVVWVKVERVSATVRHRNKKKGMFFKANATSLYLNKK